MYLGRSTSYLPFSI